LPIANNIDSINLINIAIVNINSTIIITTTTVHNNINTINIVSGNISDIITIIGIKCIASFSSTQSSS